MIDTVDDNTMLLRWAHHVPCHQHHRRHRRRHHQQRAKSLYTELLQLDTPLKMSRKLKAHVGNFIILARNIYSRLKRNKNYKSWLKTWWIYSQM